MHKPQPKFGWSHAKAVQHALAHPKSQYTSCSFYDKLTERQADAQKVVTYNAQQGYYLGEPRPDTLTVTPCVEYATTAPSRNLHAIQHAKPHPEYVPNHHFALELDDET